MNQSLYPLALLDPAGGREAMLSVLNFVADDERDDVFLDPEGGSDAISSSRLDGIYMHVS
jgi:hypothetical protein